MGNTAVSDLTLLAGADIAQSDNLYIVDVSAAVGHRGKKTTVQDLAFAIAGGSFQPADPQLTSLATLSYAGNTLKVIRVNAAETGFELADPSAGGTAWGTITGTLSAQTDLNSALAGKQASDATLTALAGQNWSLNSVPVGTGPDAVSQLNLTTNTFLARSSAGNVAAKTVTDFVFTLLDDADAASVRTTIGAGTSSFDGAFSSLSGKPTTLAGYGITDAQPLDDALTALAAGSDFVQFTGPSSTVKVFTLPNSSQTLLYSGGPLGTPSSGVATNLTGTASGLTAGTVTTNANLTGPITSVGNATSVASQTGTGTTFAMSADPTFTGTLTLATGHVTGNLTVDGDLLVSGTTTTVNTDTLIVKDPLIKLASGNAADAVDVGFYGLYTSSGSKYTGLFRDATDGKYRLFTALQSEPTTTVDTAGTGYSVATLVAALEGNVTGNLTGNAATATALATVRTIGGSNFDGTANVTSFPSPGAIGGTTPAAGTFTTLTGTSGSITGLTALAIRDTSAAFDVTLAATSSTTISAGRTLTFDVVNAARTLKLSGNPTLADWFDQSVKTGASPTFVTVTAALSGNATTASAVAVGGITGLGTGVATALAVNVGSAGAFVTFNGALGTPSSGTLTNCTFPTLNQNTTGSAASLSISGQTGLLTFTGLASTNRIKTVRDAADTILELGGSYTPTGTWTSLTMVTPVLGTPTSGTLTNCTFPVAATASGLTMATARLLGRTTASSGAIEEITVGSGLSLSGGSLTATGGGTVTATGGSLTANAVVLGAGTTDTKVSTTIITDGTSRVAFGHTAFLDFGGNSDRFNVVGTTVATGGMALAMFNATAGTAAHFDFYRSKNASAGSATVVASGDSLGAINWYGAQQTGTFATQTMAAQIRCEVDGTVTSGASGDMPGRIVFATTADAGASVTDWIILDNSGALIPALNNLTSVGKAGTAFSGLYLASAGVLDWNNGTARITNSGSNLVLTAGAIRPASDNGTALGAGATGFASLFLATDTTINFANGNWVATHSTGIVTVSPIVHIAGTNTIAPLKFTSGTNLSTAAAGAVEYDGTVFYTTPVASARGLSPSTMFSIVPAGDFNLLTTSGVQSCFPTTGDVWTLAASTAYFFEGVYFITKTTTTVTVAMAFAAGGSLSITSIQYVAEAFNAAADTTTATSSMTLVDQIASTVINATSTAATAIKFRGIIRINVGGTLTPQISFSANTTVPVMKVNSYIAFTPLGTNTTNILGNVG